MSSQTSYERCFLLLIDRRGYVAILPAVTTSPPEFEILIETNYIRLNAGNTVQAPSKPVARSSSVLEAERVRLESGDFWMEYSLYSVEWCMAYTHLITTTLLEEKRIRTPKKCKNYSKKKTLYACKRHGEKRCVPWKRGKRSSMLKERRHTMHKYRLRESCLDRFCNAWVVFTNLEISQSLPFCKVRYASVLTAFLFPNTLSGVLDLRGVVPPSFFISEWQLA